MSELRDKLTHFAYLIGSPYGEGATYERGRIEAMTDEGLELSSHLDDTSLKNFVDDLEQLVNQEVLKALDSITRPEVFATTALVDKKGKTVSPISAYKMGVNDTAKEVAKVRATYTQDTTIDYGGGNRG